MSEGSDNFATMSEDEAQPQEEKIFRTELLNDVLDYEIMSLDSRLELLIALRIPLDLCVT